jgi:dihydropteroate synthase
MGVVNVTPDSFSDGGRHASVSAAIAHARRLAEEGAAILDIGGESTRPGAQPVSIAEEIDRVVPVIAALAADGLTVSVDTRRTAVMRAAVAAGAAIVNDVGALRDEGAVAFCARSGVGVVLMHMQGEPATMQTAPHYDDVVAEVSTFLAERAAACRAAGIAAERICVDPGIGFGKSLDHNLSLLHRLGELQPPGCALLLGASRKSFIARLSRGEDVGARLPGSLAAALHGAACGVDVLRVHDVAETRQALDVWHAMRVGE